MHARPPNPAKPSWIDRGLCRCGFRPGPSRACFQGSDGAGKGFSGCGTMQRYHQLSGDVDWEVGSKPGGLSSIASDADLALALRGIKGRHDAASMKFSSDFLFFTLCKHRYSYLGQPYDLSNQYLPVFPLSNSSTHIRISYYPLQSH